MNMKRILLLIGLAVPLVFVATGVSALNFPGGNAVEVVQNVLGEAFGGNVDNQGEEDRDEVVERFREAAGAYAPGEHDCMRYICNERSSLSLSFDDGIHGLGCELWAQEEYGSSDCLTAMISRDEVLFEALDAQTRLQVQAVIDSGSEEPYAHCARSLCTPQREQTLANEIHFCEAIMDNAYHDWNWSCPMLRSYYIPDSEEYLAANLSDSQQLDCVEIVCQSPDFHYSVNDAAICRAWEELFSRDPGSCEAAQNAFLHTDGFLHGGVGAVLRAIMMEQRGIGYEGDGVNFFDIQTVAGMTPEEKQQCLDFIVDRGNRLSAEDEFLQQCDAFARVYAFDSISAQEQEMCREALGVQEEEHDDDMRARVSPFGNDVDEDDRQMWRCRYVISNNPSNNPSNNLAGPEGVAVDARLREIGELPNLVISDVDFSLGLGRVHVFVEQSGGEIGIIESFDVRAGWQANPNAQIGIDEEANFFRTIVRPAPQQDGRWQVTIETPGFSMPRGANGFVVELDVNREVHESSELDNRWVGSPVADYALDRPSVVGNGTEVHATVVQRFLNIDVPRPTVIIQWLDANGVIVDQGNIEGFPVEGLANTWHINESFLNPPAEAAVIILAVNRTRSPEELRYDNNEYEVTLLPDFFSVDEDVSRNGQRITIENDVPFRPYSGSIPVRLAWHGANGFISAEQVTARQSGETQEWVVNALLAAPASATSYEVIIDPERTILESQLANNSTWRNLDDEQLDVAEAEEEDEGEAYQPRVLPGNPLYAGKVVVRGVRLALNFSPEKKARLRMKFASEKLTEMGELEKKGKVERAAKHVPSYMKDVRKAVALADNIAEKDTPAAANVVKRGLRQYIEFRDKFDVLGDQLSGNQRLAANEQAEKLLKEVVEVSEDAFGAEVFKKVLDDVVKDVGSPAKQVEKLAILVAVEDAAEGKMKERARSAKESLARRYAARFARLDDVEREAVAKRIEEKAGDALDDIRALEEVRKQVKEPHVRTALVVVEKRVAEKIRKDWEEQSDQKRYLDAMRKSFDQPELRAFKRVLSEFDDGLSLQLLTPEEVEKRKAAVEEQELRGLPFIGDSDRSVNTEPILEPEDNPKAVNTEPILKPKVDEPVVQPLPTPTPASVPTPVSTPEPEPECGVASDCSDGNQCTTDQCVGGSCVNTERSACGTTEYSCTDGIDNDRDGEPDCDDSECFQDAACYTPPVVTEPTRPILLCNNDYLPVCDTNGVTHDNNCKAERAGATVEYDGACREPEQECRVDSDCNDSDACTQDRCLSNECVITNLNACGSTEYSCTDGVDNDRNGQTDCDDSQCSSDAACDTGIQCSTEYVCTYDAEVQAEQSYERGYAESNNLDIRYCGFCGLQ